MKRALLSFVMLLLSGICLGQSPGGNAPQPLFANQPKFCLLEGKVGRSFLNADVNIAPRSSVFYGGGGVSVGLQMKSNLFGFGARFEMIDLLDGSYSFPLHVMLRHCLGQDTRQGWFVEVRAGYILGGNSSFSEIMPMDSYDLTGTTTRSMKGPYGEVLLGYSYQRFGFFVSYHFRVINYETKYIYYSANQANCDTSWKRSMHTVMGGVEFRLF